MSNDPDFDEKRRAIVSLYLRPPPGVTILSIDEKPSIQALGRLHPDLPMRPGEPVAREFEYVRHGVMHLFAAFNVRTGLVDGEVYPDKTHDEFIDLLDRLAWRYRSGPVIGIVDNAGYHTTDEVEEWLDDHPRFQLVFTPTHASWLNQVECWFSILSRQLLARGDFAGKEMLRRAIWAYIDHWNRRAHPFDWAYGEDLLAA
jgi:transposase